jgi:hypothetical protein
MAPPSRTILSQLHDPSAELSTSQVQPAKAGMLARNLCAHDGPSRSQRHPPSPAAACHVYPISPTSHSNGLPIPSRIRKRRQVPFRVAWLDCSAASLQGMVSGLIESRKSFLGEELISSLGDAARRGLCRSVSWGGVGWRPLSQRILCTVHVMKHLQNRDAVGTSSFKKLGSAPFPVFRIFCRTIVLRTIVRCDDVVAGNKA